MRNGHRELDANLVESATQRIGREIFARAAAYKPGVFSRRYWDDRIMAWGMNDEAVKVQMFRFVDVLPMLVTGDEMARHLHEYFGSVANKLPFPIRAALWLAASTNATARVAGRIARWGALGQAKRFIAGSTSKEVLSAAWKERQASRAFTLDLLGEAVTSDTEAERYFQAYLDLIRGIAPTVNAWPENPLLDQSPYGPVPRVNMSIKLSALDSQFDAIDPVGTSTRVKRRLRELLRLAREHRAFVNVDMESYATKDLTLAIFQQILLEDEFRHTADVGIVIQCYLQDAERDLIKLRDWSRERGAPVWVRLVKGAYWDYETVYAQASGWPIPVFQQKWQSDAAYEKLTRFALENHEHLRTALGSHNIRSLAHGLAVAESLGLPSGSVEVQMLYGMADDAKRAIVDRGQRLRVYMPFGELIPGMAYLVRRLLENTANESFLRASSIEQIDPEVLLMNPTKQAGHETARPSAAPLPQTKFRPEYENEPLADFAIAANQTAMTEALSEVRGQFGKSYPLWIGGEAIDVAERTPSLNPSHKREVVGHVSAASTEHANRAVVAAKRAFPGWAAMGAARRAEYLRRAADVMRRRRFELSAWIVSEVGKGWREADADVCEAIDFCEYYAIGAISMDASRGADVPGEENRFVYMPRGVTAVISPWNFPLAILCGMGVAALATGNTVIMKPAEQSAVVGAKLMKIFNEAGLPAGVVNFLPGPGEIVGAALVEHPDVVVIAFTGSRAVGLAINRRAAEVSAHGLTSVKKVIAEMGGKNAIIVDDDADLDEAVVGVMKSAFGYQGQKCSACSRAIIVGNVYDTFLQRLVEATRSLKVGPSEDPGTSVGPLIDEESLTRVHNYVAIGCETGREALAVEIGPLADEGFYIGPHIFADTAPTSRLAQEEIFGPVLAVMRAETLDDAFSILNNTDYALTGGVFSRSPAHLERARRELMVGNLYLNRGITGALVGRQPFGGFKMSGIGSKAGGPDYLLQFVLPRTITENTMRRGFAPTTSEAT
jgi:RHH-type transcriptional regulator, proline utilization regulon repressor / proline dehydrogenase / delta 1-pyrroline-5-carboxylate dehydrogenase